MNVASLLSQPIAEGASNPRCMSWLMKPSLGMPQAGFGHCWARDKGRAALQLPLLRHKALQTPVGAFTSWTTYLKVKVKLLRSS